MCCMKPSHKLLVNESFLLICNTVIFLECSVTIIIPEIIVCIWLLQKSRSQYLSREFSIHFFSYTSTFIRETFSLKREIFGN